MPLIKGKSQKSFVKNLKTEMEHGKPQKQSLAIAYAMKRKAAKKMADGGPVLPGASSAQDSMRKAFKFAEGGMAKHKACSQCGYAEGGQVDKGLMQHVSDAKHEKDEFLTGYDKKGKDNYQEESVKPAHKQFPYEPAEKASGFVKHEGNDVKPDSMAMHEDSRKLNQHGDIEEGEQEGGQGFHGESYMGNQGDAHDNYQSEAYEEDMVGRIMKMRQKCYSEGGKVANQEHGVNDSKLAGFSPNEFDDLVLRDDLSSTYGDDDNAGDSLDNEQEDEDRKDIVARIMASRKKKDRMPTPA